MSFDLLDAKWGPTPNGTPSGEVTWAADVDDSITSAGGFTTANYENAVQAAFNAWEDAAAITFTKINNFAAADITIDMASFPGDTVGEASILTALRPGVDEMLDVDILLDSDETWTPFGTGGNTSFFAVATHEIGHAIGLDHVNDESEIMNPRISTNELGDGDVRGAQVIYGRDSGDLNVADLVDDGGGDDGGGGGAGGIILALLGLLGLLFGIGGGAAAPLVLAAEDHDDHDDYHDPEGEDLIALLDDAVQGATKLETHVVYVDEIDSDHDHDVLL